MVDRIVPATAPADIASVEQRFGYRDGAVVVGEPFRQWVIEDRFAGRTPPWDLVGATFVDDVTPFEQLKMRVLNGAQTTLCLSRRARRPRAHLRRHGRPAAGRTSSAACWSRRRCRRCRRCRASSPIAYVEQSLGRLRNTAIRHRNHQIATDGSQKIVQRLLNPIRERLRARRQTSTLLSVAVAAWMVYLVRASDAVRTRVDASTTPMPARIAAIADRVGRDTAALAARNPRHRRDLRPRTRRDGRLPRALVARHSTACWRRSDRLRRRIVPAGRARIGAADDRRREDDEARNSDRAVSGHAAGRGRRLGRARRVSRRWRSPAGRRPPARPAAMPAPAISTSTNLAQRRRRRSSPRWPSEGLADLGARLLSEPAASRRRAPRDGDRASEEGDRRGRADGRRRWSTPSAAATPRRPSTRTGRTR